MRLLDLQAALLDMQERGLSELARASAHYYNSEKGLERFCAALERVRRKE